MSIDMIALGGKKFTELENQCIYTFKAGTPVIPSYTFDVKNNGYGEINDYSCSRAYITLPDSGDADESQYAESFIFHGNTLAPDGTEYATFISNNQTRYNVKVSDLKGILKYATITPLGG